MGLDNIIYKATTAKTVWFGTNVRIIPDSMYEPLRNFYKSSVEYRIYLYGFSKYCNLAFEGHSVQKRRLASSERFGQTTCFLAVFRISINSIESNDYDTFYHNFITVLSHGIAVVKSSQRADNPSIQTFYTSLFL